MKKVLSVLALVMSLPVAAEQPNMKTTSEAYKDWVVACVEQEGVKRCEMKQTLIKQNQQTIAVFSAVKRSQKDTLMQIALPHMLDLTIPVKMTVDGKLVKNLPFKFCNQVACFVLMENDKQVIDAFKVGTAGEVEVQVMNGQQMKLDFSLSGFSAAMNNLPVGDK